MPPAKVNKNAKSDVVYNILKRWWYCLPDWPPKDFDFNAELTKNKLKLVEISKWRQTPEIDEKGIFFLLTNYFHVNEFYIIMMQKRI